MYRSPAPMANAHADHRPCAVQQSDERRSPATEPTTMTDPVSSGEGKHFGPDMVRLQSLPSVPLLWELCEAGGCGCRRQASNVSARVFWLMHARAAKQRLLPASGQGCVNALVGFEFTCHDAKGVLRMCACCGPHAMPDCARFGVGMVWTQIVWRLRNLHAQAARGLCS